jgi:hypothetical protein
MPILAEVYNLGTPEYYAVAVVKIRDDDSELIYLKRRKSCHSGADSGISKNYCPTNSGSPEVELRINPWIILFKY